MTPSFSPERLTLLDAELQALDYAIEAAAQPFHDYIADDISMLQVYDEDEVPDYATAHPAWKYRENNTYAFYGLRRRVAGDDHARWHDSRYDDTFLLPLAYVTDRTRWKAEYREQCAVYDAAHTAHQQSQQRQQHIDERERADYEQREYTRLHAKYGDQTCV